MRVLLVFVFALSLGFYLNVDRGKRFATPVQEAKPALTYQQRILAEHFRKLRAQQALTGIRNEDLPVPSGENVQYYPMQVSDTAYRAGDVYEVEPVGHGETIRQEAVDVTQMDGDETYQVKDILRSKRWRARKIRYVHLLERGRVSWTGREVVPASALEKPDAKPEEKLVAGPEYMASATGGLLVREMGRIASRLPAAPATKAGVFRAGALNSFLKGRQAGPDWKDFAFRSFSVRVLHLFGCEDKRQDGDGTL